MGSRLRISAKLSAHRGRTTAAIEVHRTDSGLGENGRSGVRDKGEWAGANRNCKTTRVQSDRSTESKLGYRERRIGTVENTKQVAAKGHRAASSACSG